ncbi:hypothetical protein GQX74_007009 [Glossina fuscipes]|nr:hypothetical protein GQX74_007009 [Glossina fuscipes]
MHRYHYHYHYHYHHHHHHYHYHDHRHRCCCRCRHRHGTRNTKASNPYYSEFTEYEAFNTIPPPQPLKHLGYKCSQPNKRFYPLKAYPAQYMNKLSNRDNMFCMYKSFDVCSIFDALLQFYFMFFCIELHCTPYYMSVVVVVVTNFDNQCTVE